MTPKEIEAHQVAVEAALAAVAKIQASVDRLNELLGWLELVASRPTEGRRHDQHRAASCSPAWRSSPASS